MTEDPETVAEPVSERLILRHREVNDQVKEHNARIARLRRDVEALACDFSDRLPGHTGALVDLLQHSTIWLRPAALADGAARGRGTYGANPCPSRDGA